MLCFSLAIRIRCLATMAWALGSALHFHLQGSPREPQAGPSASRPPRALQVARRGPGAWRTPLPNPHRAGSRERPEPGARTEVIFHLRKPSPTSSPSFRSSQLPNQRGPEAALPRVLPAPGGRSAARSCPDPGLCSVGVPQPDAAGPRAPAAAALCTHRGWGLSGAWVSWPGNHQGQGNGLGQPHFSPSRGSTPAPLPSG